MFPVGISICHVSLSHGQILLQRYYCQLFAGQPQRDHVSFHAFANYEQIRTTVSFLMRLLLGKKCNPLYWLTVGVFNSHDCFLWSRSPLCLWQKRSQSYFCCIGLLTWVHFFLFFPCYWDELLGCSWICAYLLHWMMVSVSLVVTRPAFPVLDQHVKAALLPVTTT